MDVLGILFVFLSLCSEEALSSLEKRTRIGVDPGNDTGNRPLAGGQQMQFADINSVGTLSTAMMGRTNNESRPVSSNVADGIRHLTSVHNQSLSEISNYSVQKTNGSSWWKSSNVHNSAKPKEEVNSSSEVFQKYRTSSSVGVSLQPETTAKAATDWNEHGLTSSAIVNDDDDSGGMSVFLSGFSKANNKVLHTQTDLQSDTELSRDVYESLHGSESESWSNADVSEEIEKMQTFDVSESGINEHFGKLEAAENRVLGNYTETATTEEQSTENSAEDNDAQFRDAEGNPIPCKENLSVLVNGSTITNGSLYSPVYNVTFPPGFFWKSENNSYFGCICSLFPCIRKCCPEGKMYPPKGDVCIPLLPGLQPFLPKYYDESTHKAVEVDEEPKRLYGFPCKHAYRLDPVFSDEEHYLLPNGSILLPYYNSTVEPDEYCMEMFEGKEDISVLKCFTEDVNYDYDENDITAMILYPAGMLISIPFLIVTFLVYGIIPELRNLHGKSLMCHVSSLAVAYIFLSTVQLGNKSLNPNACVAFAFIIFFAFLASFFWLNVMCFDIFWTFSGMRPLRGSVKERESKKFLMYSCYAWGAPFILLIVCIIMDFMPNIPPDVIKPELGVTKCWFSNDPALTAYFFGPVGTLLLCNLLFFVITAIRIFKLKQETAMLKGRDSRKNDDKANRQRFNLYLKLFVVMGVTWIMEVVSYVIGGPTSMWYLSDLCNTLQGLLIFLLFVCKKNVRSLLRRKCGKEFEQRSSGSQRSHIVTSRTTSITTVRDRASTDVEDGNNIHLKPMGSYVSKNDDPNDSPVTMLSCFHVCYSGR